MIYIFIAGFFFNLGILTSLIFGILFLHRPNKEDIIILLITGFNSLGFYLAVSLCI